MMWRDPSVSTLIPSTKRVELVNLTGFISLLFLPFFLSSGMKSTPSGSGSAAVGGEERRKRKEAKEAKHGANPKKPKND
jgi:hypothetical protein